MWWKYLITFLAGAWTMFIIMGIFIGGRGGD